MTTKNNVIPNNGKQNHECGQSFLELALMLVFLLTLFVATIDLGWMFFTTTSLRQAAQEGSTFASICPDQPSMIRDRLRYSSSYPGDLASVPDDQIEICVINPGTGACDGTITIGNDLRVSVTYYHDIFTPFIGAFINSQQYPITVSATNVILQTTCPSSLVAP